MNSFIGIDLGTTFSAIARLDEHGKSVIVHGTDGDNLMPSCVAFVDGKIEVGTRAAKRQASLSPATDAAARFKREIGTSKKYDINNKQYSPQDLSALVLEKLVRDRKEQIGEIAEVVVAVPANFGDQQRRATMDAAKKAGLNINYIINEPTAAALCYSFREEMVLDGIYAVYDMGGGTFDISIIRVSGSNVEVLTSNGVQKLGGVDFDKILLKLAMGKINTIGDVAKEVVYDMKNSEDAKKELSNPNREKITERVATSVGTKAIQIARAEFEELLSSAISQAEMTCEASLHEVGLTAEDITGVLCAGGSTRIPLVRHSIRKVFKQEPMFKANVDEVVALGAALYAAYKHYEANPATDKLYSAQKKMLDKMKLTEVTGKYYGTRAVVNDELQNSIIIQKNTSIPCEKSESYRTMTDGQTAVDCSVTECANEEIDMQFVEIIQEDIKLPLPPDRPAGQKIKVTFRYDANQIMHCEFVDVETGKKREINLSVQPKERNDVDIDDFTVE